MAVEQNLDTTAVYINYGQLAHKSEQAAASKISKFLDLDLHCLEVNLGNTFAGGEILGRNLMLLSMSLTSNIIDAGMISLGIHSGTQYFDCSEFFFSQADKLVREISSDNIRLSAPLLKWDKAEIFGYALSKNIPIDITFSCESKSGTPCKECLSCLDRRELC